jgi:hypothetical protein
MGPRQAVRAGSVLDLSWMDAVSLDEGLLITAQGLLMYLHPEQVQMLLCACAQRFPGATMVIDTIPPWMARAVPRASARATGYRPPPMYWCVDSADWPSLRDLHPNIVEVAEVRSAPGRGPLGRLPANIHRIPWLRRHRAGVVRLRFGRG